MSKVLVAPPMVIYREVRKVENTLNLSFLLNHIDTTKFILNVHWVELTFCFNTNDLDLISHGQRAH